MQPLNDITRCIIAARLAKIEAQVSDLRRAIDPEPALVSDIRAVRKHITPRYPAPKPRKEGR